MTAALETRSLRVGYRHGRRARTVVLDDVSLTLAPGQFACLIGPNGSGKSTLIDVLLGRLPLRSGRRVTGSGVVLGELTQLRSELARGEPGRVQPDSHRVFAFAKNQNIANARDALERVFHIYIEIIRNVLVGETVVGREKSGCENKIRVRLRDRNPGVLDLLWQAALGGCDPVLNVDCSNV